VSNSSTTCEQPKGKPLQFSLRGLLIAMVGIATVLAILFQWGAIVGGLCGFVVGIALLVYAMWCDRALASPAAVLALLAGCMSLLRIAAPVELSRRSACVVNLKQIALALHNYHDTYGTFPPAYVADENGRPMHSWRVLILPFLESSDVYSKYRFDEPWDGPHNRLLADRMPYAYRCPSESRNSPPSRITSYVAVVVSRDGVARYIVAVTWRIDRRRGKHAARRRIALLRNSLDGTLRSVRLPDGAHDQCTGRSGNL
jgi:hypothetical protein